MNANFLWATITVKSIETSLPFYEDLLGLTVERRFMPHPALELCFLKDDNGIEVELLEHKQATDAVTAPASLSLGFRVADLEEAMAACKDRGIDIVSGPFEGAGVKFFFVNDPDGVNVQFVQK